MTGFEQRPGDVRNGQLIEAAAACVADLLSAVSVTESLPALLTRLATVLPIERVSVIESASGASGDAQANACSPCFSWQAPGTIDSQDAALAALSVPIVVAGRHWGQIDLSGGDKQWSVQDLKVLTLLAQVIGTAMSHERQLAQSQERLAQLARTDALTGAANRVIFNERLRQAFAGARRGATAFAVLYLDLDRFKEVNDTLGHHAGDLLLQQVAHRLGNATLQIDVVARLGGDEFAIIQAEVADSSAAGTLAEKLIEVVHAPYLIEGNELRIGVSIGIALWDRDSASPDSLLTEADQALYRAKHAGRGQYRFHSEEIDHETREQLALAEDLRAALLRGELEIRYQPQVELASGRIVGMEALLRWNHRTRGLLLPEDFLPIAEKFGIMQQLGRWTLDGACQQMSLWRQQQMSVPVVAINVALAQIKMGAEFVRDVRENLDRWSLKPSDLELDVTEQVLARSTLSQSSVLIELRRLGVGIAIDDFGAKYSSLDYLRTYDVTRLKIAPGMVAAAGGQPGGSAMIRAILSLAAELGLDVLAEGIETETQRDLLLAASARAQGQGFYYGQAVTASQSMSMLRAGAVRPPGDGGIE